MARPRIRTSGVRPSGDVMIQCWTVSGACQRISYRDAKRLEEVGDATWLRNPKHEIFGIKMRVLLRAKEESPRSISARESYVFATKHHPGCGSVTINLSERKRKERMDNGRQAEDHAELTISKIMLWPIIGSDRNIRAGFSQKAVEDAYAFDAKLHYEGAHMAGAC